MKGYASNLEREGPLLFLAVRKRHPQHCRPLEDGGATGKASVFDAFVPLLLAALPADFFVASGRSNQEPSRPILTVLPLLRAERLQDGEGGREDGDSSFLEEKLLGSCCVLLQPDRPLREAEVGPRHQSPAGETGW